MNQPLLARDLLAREMLALIAAAREGARRVAATEAGGDGGPDTHDAEAVHDFRVSLRRLRTLLRVARAVWGKKRLARLRDELRSYAQVTGVLRDEEVLVETLQGLTLPEGPRAAVDAWLAARAPAAGARRAHAAQILRDGPPPGFEVGEKGRHLRRLDRSLERLAERLDAGKARQTSADEVGRRALAEAAEGVLARVSASPQDAPAMHALRIRFKRLRYTAELFAEVFGPLVDELAKGSAKMQKRLGEVHDLDEALGRIGGSAELDEGAREATLAALRAQRAAVVRKARADLDRLEPALQAALALGEGDGAEVVGPQTTT